MYICVWWDGILLPLLPFLPFPLSIPSVPFLFHSPPLPVLSCLPSPLHSSPLLPSLQPTLSPHSSSNSNKMWHWEWPYKHTITSSHHHIPPQTEYTGDYMLQATGYIQECKTVCMLTWSVYYTWPLFTLGHICFSTHITDHEGDHEVTNSTLVWWHIYLPMVLMAAPSRRVQDRVCHLGSDFTQVDHAY